MSKPKPGKREAAVPLVPANQLARRGFSVGWAGASSS